MGRLVEKKSGGPPFTEGSTALFCVYGEKAIIQGFLNRTNRACQTILSESGAYSAVAGVFAAAIRSGGV